MQASSANTKPFSSRLLPNPFDALVILATAYWIACAIASISWYGDVGIFDQRGFLQPVLGGAGAVLAAIGSACGFGRCRWKSVWLLAIVVLLGVPIYLAFGWFVTVPFSLDFFGYSNRGVYFGVSNLWYAIVVAISLVGCLAIPYVIVHLLRFLGGYVGDFGGKLRKNRTRNLIILAVVLLVLAKLQTLFGWLEGTGASQTVGGGVPVPYQILLGLVVYGLVAWLFVFVPGQFLTSRKWFTGKFFVAAVFSVGLGVFVSVFSWEQPRTISRLIWVVSVSVVVVNYFFAILVLSRSREPDSSTKSHDSLGRPSIWSFLLAGPVVLLFAAGLYIFDPVFFLDLGSRSRNSGKGTPSAIELAQLSRNVQLGSGGAVRLAPAFPGAFWLINTQSSDDPNCLANLPAPKSTFGPAHIVIENLHASVDTAPLNNWINKFITLAGGSVTNKQLADLFANCQYGMVRGEVELPETIDSTIAIPDLAFVGEKPFSITKVLDRLIVVKDNGQIVIETPILLEDWEAIVRASQYRNVRISLPLPPEVFASAYRKNALKNIRVFPRANPIEDPELIKFANHTGIVVSFSGGMEQERWLTMFVLPSISDGMWNKLQIPSCSDVEFKKLSREFGWAFDWDDANNITRLWMPDSVTIADHINILGEIKTLRMDARGINGVVAVGAILVDGKEIAMLPKLESLYLPSEIQLNELSFLKKLKKLNHLQIASQDRTLQTGTGVEACPSIKTIRMFAAPDVKMLSELSQLPNLKQLFIIDEKAELTTPCLVNALQEKLPNVELQVIAAEDFQPDIDQDFAEHVQRLRERLVEIVSKKPKQ